MASAPRIPVPPTFPAMRKPPALPWSAGRVVAAMSPSAAAAAVVLATWAMVQSTVKSFMCADRSGRKASAPRSRPVAMVITTYQDRRRPSKSMSGAHRIFRPCGARVMPETQAMTASDTPSSSSQRGTAIEP